MAPMTVTWHTDVPCRDGGELHQWNPVKFTRAAFTCVKPCSPVRDSQVTVCRGPKPISHLGLQINVGQRHLGDFVEAQRERDGAQDEERVVDRHPHQHDDAGVSRGRSHQQGTDNVHH